MKKRPFVWVCKDLSNGGGNKYVWMFETRAGARKQKRVHDNNSTYSRLSTPYRLARRTFNRIYAPIEDCVCPEYHERREGSDA